MAENDTSLPLLLVARGGAIDGAGRQLLYLVTHLDRSRFNPLVLLDEPGPMLDALRDLKTEARISRMSPWRSLRGFPFRRSDKRSATRIAREHGAALVHCSDPWRAPYARHIAGALDIPWVLHVRGPTRPRDLQKYLCLDADQIIGIAERYRPEIEAAGFPPQRISIIDDAVDTQTYKPDAIARLRVREQLGAGGRFVVGIVGRIEPLKRIEEFVDAALLVPRDLDATFLLIGAMHKQEYAAQITEKIARHGRQDRIRFVGRRDDMPAVLASLDLMVTLSGGSVMFEAMACGTCVLSVRPDGRHSQHTITGQTACCITTDRPELAAQAITQLLRDDSLRTRLAYAGRACVTERLCPRLMARKTQAVYETALAERLPSER